MTPLNYFNNVKSNFTNYNYIALINTLIALAISGYYIPQALAIPTNIYQLLYLICLHIGNILIIATTAWLVFLPVVLFPKTIMRLVLPIVAVSCLIALLVDTILYKDLAIHINAISLIDIINKTIDLDTTHQDFIFLLIAILLLLSFEYWLLLKQEYNPSTRINLKKYYPYIFAVDVLMLVVYFSYDFVDAKTKEQLAKLTSYSVVFPQTSITLMHALNHQLDNNFSFDDITRILSGKNNYVKNPMQYSQVKKPKNIIIIAIDAWRFDRLNEVDSPNLWNYAKSGTRFNNHISSGNRTKDGLFGIFYGISPSYYQLFKYSKQSPVLIDRLQQLDYNIGIFAATTLKLHCFNEVFFSKIDNLRLCSTADTSAMKDKQATDDWMQWYDDNKSKNQPMFSMLFYDSVRAYDFPKSFNYKYQPSKGNRTYASMVREYSQEEMNQIYSISVSYVDSLAGKILNKLKAEGDLENTLIIITADHGNELNDNGQNYWGYDSNFTRFQVQVPFVIIDQDFQQKKSESVCNELTSHYDIVPTLMKNFLGAENDIADYSNGLDLLGNLKMRNWVLVSGRKKYLNHVNIFTENYSIKLLNSGFYQLLDSQNQPLPTTKLFNVDYIKQAFEMMHKFAK